MTGKKVTGVILAGGKNSRMGADKGLLVVNGKPIVERIVLALKNQVDDILIISNGNNYDYLGYKVYSDLIADCGPMGGIFTALSYSVTDWNLVVACDMPLVNPKLFALIIKNSVGCDIAIPKYGEKLQPLCALYHRSCRGNFERLLRHNELKLLDALPHFRVKKIPVPQIGFGKNCFGNINTPTEYETLKLKKNGHSN